MAEKFNKENFLSFLEAKRTVTVKYLNNETIYEYALIGQERRDIEKKYTKNLTDVTPEFIRKLCWAMLHKANPEDFDEELERVMPPELLDLIYLEITKDMGLVQGDFLDESSNETQKSSTS